jgi:hypothetical protein
MQKCELYKNCKEESRSKQLAYVREVLGFKFNW